MTDETLAQHAVRVAASNLGYGEVDGNNDGPLIRAIGGHPGEEWCALFAGYCYRRAAALRGDPPPLWAYRRPGVLEVGAKALVRALAKADGGRAFEDPTLAQPGDLVCWHRRSGPISWQGHVGIVTAQAGGIIETIEGNTGVFPSKVRRLRHDVTRERLYMFAGLR